MAFDEDCDEVLTIQEIRDGLRINDINLTDTETQALIEAIDANHDGILTEEEWVAILTPKIDA
jgi:Ca2+-binding EF-hand superfamily protein